MRRTQIYLNELQSRTLDELARQGGRTKSALIREAIDVYLAPSDASTGIDRLRAALTAAAGAAPGLPPGDEYVDALRASDTARVQAQDERW